VRILLLLLTTIIISRQSVIFNGNEYTTALLTVDWTISTIDSLLYHCNKLIWWQFKNESIQLFLYDDRKKKDFLIFWSNWYDYYFLGMGNGRILISYRDKYFFLYLYLCYNFFYCYTEYLAISCFAILCLTVSKVELVGSEDYYIWWYYYDLLIFWTMILCLSDG